MNQVAELLPHPYSGLFPLLSPADLDLLATDIKENGLQQEIILHQETILDGRNRYAACSLVGVAPRFKDYKGNDPLKFVVSMNLRRRHLSTSQRSIIAAELSGPNRSNHGGDRKSEDQQANLPVDRAEAAALLNVSERSVKNAAALIEADPTLADEIKAGADETVSGALKKAKRAKREQKARKETQGKEAAARAEIAKSPEVRYSLHHGSLEDWRPTDVSSIITDPPYIGDSIPLYEHLRDFAVDVLPEGAPLVVMTWQGILPGVIRALDHPELSYRWTICWRYDNAENTVDHTRRVFDCWKPVLVYHKGGMPKNAPMLRDEIANTDADKDFHEWGQSVSGFERLVKTFSQPGETVCDPFLGGGTTAIAALGESRKFIGCDVDEEAIATTHTRLEERRTDGHS